MKYYIDISNHPRTYQVGLDYEGMISGTEDISVLKGNLKHLSLSTFDWEYSQKTKKLLPVNPISIIVKKEDLEQGSCWGQGYARIFDMSICQCLNQLAYETLLMMHRPQA